MHMIGVSIAIPPPFAGELQKRRASYGDPLADFVPTHVTLLPPTEVDDGASRDRRASRTRRRLAAALHHALRSTGTFRPVSPVVFVQVAGGIGPASGSNRPSAPAR